MDVILEFFKSIDWSTISANVVIIGLIIWAVIKHFSKPFIKSLGEETAKLVFTKKITEAEESVKSIYNKDLELFKFELEKRSIEMKAKSENFYKDRADFIVKLFKLLTNYYSSVYHITEIKANNGNLKDIINNYDKNKASLKTALEDLNNYYAPNRIYLKKQLASLVFQFYNSIFTSFKEYIKLLNSSDNEKIEKLNQITETIGNVKHKELDDILDRFREILYPETELTSYFSTDKDNTKETQS